MIKRVFLVVLDGLGIGELPDAAEYDDLGSNTLENLSYAVGGVSLPNMEMLGLGCLGDFKGISKKHHLGVVSRCTEASAGKDSSIGHWEIAGRITHEHFPVYPQGFPKEFMDRFEQKIGRSTLCNEPASGIDVIERLGDEHVRTGRPIVYTSADSVFQVAAHEGIIKLDELYRICNIARDMLVPPHGVLRVIARPFKGDSGGFYRTEARKDFSLKPPSPTLLDLLKNAGLETWGIGKIDELFVFQGLSNSFHTRNNKDSLQKLQDCLSADFTGLVFANIIDFDMLYGHRNDPKGYADALAYFDTRLGMIMAAMDKDDLLFITSDHGNDPTTPGTDHSREYTPLLIYGENLKQGLNLGTRSTFSDIGKTIADIFLPQHDLSCLDGASFWHEIRR